MSQAPLIPYTISFESLLREYAITEGRLLADKEARALAASNEKFRPKLIDALLQEFLLNETQIIAQEGIHGVDEMLNEVSILVLETALAHTKGSYTAQLYDHLAAQERPRAFIRPILGNQLSKVRTWIELLKDASVPEELRALQLDVAGAVSAADEAISAREKASEERSRFWKIGQKRQLIDDFNQQRRELFTQLEALNKDNPEEYARGFFAERAAETRIEGEVLVNSLKEKIAQNEAAVALLREQLIAAEQDLTKKQREEEEREETRVALAQEERAIAEAKRRAQELRAKLSRR